MEEELIPLPEKKLRKKAKREAFEDLMDDEITDEEYGFLMGYYGEDEEAEEEEY